MVFTPYYRGERGWNRIEEEERGGRRMERGGRRRQEETGEAEEDRKARLALRLGRRARGGEKDGEFWQLPPLDRASFG